ncbi:MAG: hypothetical protein GY738_02830, partial [Pseudoalteromonas sp.]|nr:hypothetical protein [Pseudoalteromonas sp.]
MEFEDRAVAFVDVLGFKALVNNAVNDKRILNQLRELVHLLSTAVPTLDKSVDSTIPKHLIPKHQYISDCIILSAPLNDATHTYYNGLETIVM